MKTKKYLNVFIVAVSLIMSCATASQASASTTGQTVSIEISAVLISPEYATIVAAQRNAAQTNGRSLKVSGFEVTQIGDQTYAYILLSSKISADLNGDWTPAGTITAGIEHGPMGEVYTDGVYFKPAEQGPGGASVENN